MKKIPLTQGQFALIDDEDFESVSKYKWQALWVPGSKNFVASTSVKDGEGKNTKKYMHRFIVNAPIGMEVDHKNHDTLDNRKANLRLCTHQQNVYNKGLTKANTSGYKGVYKDKAKKKWKVQIAANRKLYYVGAFQNKEDAARAYNVAAKQLHKDFAFLNII